MTDKVTRGSGNVFADIGVADPEGALAKARLAVAIMGAIEERGLNQRAAARLAGVTQPQISNILRGRLGVFSREKLMDVLAALGKDVEVVIKDRPKSRSRGLVRVVLRTGAKPRLKRVKIKHEATAGELSGRPKHAKAVELKSSTKGHPHGESKVAGRQARDVTPEGQQWATERSQGQQ